MRRSLSFFAISAILTLALVIPGLGQGDLKKTPEQPKDSQKEVTVVAKADKADASGKQVVTLSYTINKGWHIYGNPVGIDLIAAAKTEVAVSAKMKPVSVKIDFPTPQKLKDNEFGYYNAYLDKVKITATVERAKGDTSPLEVSTTFSACSDETGICLMPATVKLTVP